MRAVTLHAFCVTVYGNNNNMKKTAMIKKHNKKHTDTERIDCFLYFTVFVVKNFEFRSM